MPLDSERKTQTAIRILIVIQTAIGILIREFRCLWNSERRVQAAIRILIGYPDGDWKSYQRIQIAFGTLNGEFKRFLDGETLLFHTHYEKWR